MTDREKFEAAIDENPLDDVTRKVFADWLDENGFPDEAIRQRDWEAVKKASMEWIEDFAAGIASDDDAGIVGDGPSYNARRLIGVAQRYVERDDAEYDNEASFDSDSLDWSEFWKHYQIVTSKKVNSTLHNDYPFRCAC